MVSECFLDRRIDPRILIKMQASEIPLERAFEKVAEQNGWGISYLPPIVYIGPSTVTQELATHLHIQRQRLRRLPKRTQRLWTVPRDLDWPRLTEPRRLIAEQLGPLAGSAVGIDRVPYDLWDEQAFTGVDRLLAVTILLAGFDLAIALEPDGTLIIDRFHVARRFDESIVEKRLHGRPRAAFVSTKSVFQQQQCKHPRWPSSS